MTPIEPGQTWGTRLAHILSKILHTRRGRRIWVAGMYALLLCGVVSAIGLKPPPTSSVMRFYLLIFVPFFLLSSPLRRWARPGQRSDGSTIPVPTLFGVPLRSPFDERENAVRLRAFSRAYHAVVLCVAALVVPAYIFQEDLPNWFRALASRDGVLLLGFGIAILIATLPLAFQAWDEPDDDLDPTAPPLAESTESVV